MLLFNNSKKTRRIELSSTFSLLKCIRSESISLALLRGILVGLFRPQHSISSAKTNIRPQTVCKDKENLGRARAMPAAYALRFAPIAGGNTACKIRAINGGTPMPAAYGVRFGLLPAAIRPWGLTYAPWRIRFAKLFHDTTCGTIITAPKKKPAYARSPTGEYIAGCRGVSASAAQPIARFTHHLFDSVQLVQNIKQIIVLVCREILGQTAILVDGCKRG